MGGASDDLRRREPRPAEVADAASRTSQELPEVMVRGLNRLYGAVEPLLAHYRGHLDRYTGYGLLAEFDKENHKDSQPEAESFFAKVKELLGGGVG